MGRIPGDKLEPYEILAPIADPMQDQNPGLLRWVTR
jgi:hypothetical protein